MLVCCNKNSKGFALYDRPTSLKIINGSFHLLKKIMVLMFLFIYINVLNKTAKSNKDGGIWTLDHQDHLNNFKLLGLLIIYGAVALRYLWMFRSNI